MRVLVDSDVLLDVGLDRGPWADDSSDVFDLCESGVLDGFVAWHTLANLYYFVRQRGANGARAFIAEVLSAAQVVPVGHADMQYALELDMSDLEDAMQVAAAVACRAARIITRNTRHYRKSPIPAVTPAAFLRTLRKA